MIQFSSALTVLSSEWQTVKAQLTAKGILGCLQYVEDATTYTIFAFDGPLAYMCVISKGEVPAGVAITYAQETNDTDKAEFEATYKATANQVIEKRSPDGRAITRNTTANRMTNFKLRAISFYTADLEDGVHNWNPVTDADYGDITVKLYQADGTEITDAADEGLATKTVLDWEPTYNYEIIGGFVDIPQVLKGGVTDAWYLSAIGVPHYPPAYYGSIDFISEVNLEAVTTEKVISDGRAISYMPYNLNGAPHTNLMRFILKHPAGDKKRFQLYVEHYV